jgi:hypothetical protein
MTQVVLFIENASCLDREGALDRRACVRSCVLNRKVCTRSYVIAHIFHGAGQESIGLGRRVKQRSTLSALDRGLCARSQARSIAPSALDLTAKTPLLGFHPLIAF